MGLGFLLASAAAAEVVSARYIDPTDRYPHGVLGDPSEYTTLEVITAEGQRIRRTWERPLVYEDTAPRLVDVTGDGSPEVVVVESHERLGARFAILELRDGELTGLVANPFIGTRFRWLAIVGIADFDGDGFTDVAYVDRPHLAKTLRVWRVRPVSDGTASVEQVASLPGVTNHRIGEVDIAGGVRDCGAGPEMIVADAGWSRLLAVAFDGPALAARDLGPHRGRASFVAAMAC
ncbi:MAG: VCBS repeat-containing protein [Pseudomonadota bacterium]